MLDYSGLWHSKYLNEIFATMVIMPSSTSQRRSGAEVVKDPTMNICVHIFWGWGDAIIIEKHPTICFVE